MSDHTSFPMLISHRAITRILDFLHIPVILEVLKQATSRRKRGGGGPASVGVPMGWPVSAGEPHAPGAESEL